MNEISIPSRRDLLDRIDHLHISADAKVLLARLASTTAVMAGRVVEIGRRILAFALETAKMFPNTAFGVIVGSAMALLIGSMAVLGAVLGPILGPLLIAVGLGIGAVSDIKNDALRARIVMLEREFGTLAHG